MAGATTISALQLVGCPSVLGALSEVEADGTAEILKRVRITGRANRGGWAEALRQAQPELRAEGTDSTVWAAFTLYGSAFA